MQPDLFTIYRTPRHDHERGMQTAADHADAVATGWSDRAYALLLAFASGGGEFLAEQARDYAHRSGLPAPPDGRAWGAVIRRASAAKAIAKVRHETDQYGSPKAVWRAA